MFTDYNFTAFILLYYMVTLVGKWGEVGEGGCLCHSALLADQEPAGIISKQPYDMVFYSIGELTVCCYVQKSTKRFGGLSAPNC